MADDTSPAILELGRRSREQMAARAAQMAADTNGTPAAAAPDEAAPGILELGRLSRQQMMERGAANAPAPSAAPTPAPEAPRRSLIGRVADYVTGEDRTEYPDLPELTNAPELNTSLRGALTGGGYALTRDPARLRDVIERQNPGATFAQDRYGNDIVTLPSTGPGTGGRFYVNKPGVSMADALGAVSPILEGAAAMRGGRLGTRLPGRMLGAGVASGAASVGIDAGASALGGAPGIEGMATNAGIAAASGAAGEALPAIIGGVRTVLNRMGITGERLVDRSGAINATGQRVLQEAGIDPATLSPDNLTTVLRAAREVGGSIEQRGTAAARAATEVRANEAGIPRTVGQRTNDDAQLVLEDSLRHNGLPGGQALRDFDQQQRQAIDAAGNRIREGLSGNTGVPRTQADVGQTLADGITRLRAARAAADTAAYDRVGTLGTGNGGQGGRQVVFAPDAAADMERRLTEVATDYVTDPRGTPLTSSVMRNLRRLATADGGATLGGVETARRQIGNTLNGISRASPEYAPLSRLRSLLDDWVDTAVERGHFSGDAAAVDALKAARASRRQTAELFSPENVPALVPRVIELAERDGLSGLDLYRRLAGTNQSPEGASAAIDHFATMFGRQSPVFSALREGHVDRLISGAGDTGTPATLHMMAKRISEATSPAGREYAVTRSLFSAPEIAQLAEHGNLLRELARQTDKRNKSGSAYTFSTIARQMLGMAVGTSAGAAVGGQAGAIIGNAAAGAVGDRLAGMVGASAARDAIRPGATTLARRPVSALMRMGSAIGSQASGIAPAGLARLGHGAMDLIEPQRDRR